MRFLRHHQCLYIPFSKRSALSSSFNLMGSFPLCKSTSLVFLSPLSSSSSSSSSSSQRCFLYKSNSLLHGSFPVRLMSHGKPFSMKLNGVSSFTSHANVPRPPAFLENPLGEALSSTQSNVLKKKLQELDIDTESCVPGQTNHLLCPMLVAYFAEGLISKNPPLRNSVMQKRSNNQIAIASTYYRRGALVSCKYHDVNKKFLQDIEASIAVLLSFRILPKDLVSMAIDCPAILDLEFLKEWEASLSLIELHNVSVSMIRSMLVLSKRFQLDSCIFLTTVDLLKRCGFRDAAVTRVLEDYPEIVFTNEEEILRTIEFLMGIGIRRDEIDWIICSIPKVLGFKVDGRLQSLIGEFNELGFDQNVIGREIVREPRILATELGEVSRCLEFLSNLKCRNSIKEKIFRDGALRAAFEVKQRVDCLCKHGLIRTRAFKLLWREPRLVTYEIENVEKKIDFLTHKMKFGVDCLIDVPEYLGINFEKQIVPRYHVIEYLKSKGWLGSQVGLREIIKPSRLKFYNLFVKPYPECGKMFGKFVGENETKSPSRHPIGLWKVFKPQRHPESKEDTNNMKSFMESLV